MTTIEALDLAIGALCASQVWKNNPKGAAAVGALMTHLADLREEAKKEIDPPDEGHLEWTIAIQREIKLTKLMVHTQSIATEGEALRLLQSGRVKLNGEIVSDHRTLLFPGEHQLWIDKRFMTITLYDEEDS